MVKILQKDNSILREKSLPVDTKEIRTNKIQNILKEMTEALESQDDGVAIACPQVGYNLRIFTVSHKVFEMTKRYSHIKEDLVFINPEIIKKSKEVKEMEEGCLSVRWLYGKVKRSNKVTVKAIDQTGKEFVMGASSLLAQIFQHEIDHLDGIFFTDKAKDLEEIKPKEIKK
jgi:peptide deformylase